jgi:hypothetical protein
VTTVTALQPATVRAFSLEHPLRYLVALAALLLPLIASAVTVTCTPPTANTDNTPLTNLSGFRFLYGTQANALDKSVTMNTPSVCAASIGTLAAGKWYFTVTAVAASGIESEQAAMASLTIADTPPPLVTAGPYSYEDIGTATAPKMAAIGLVLPGLSCGPTVRTVGTVKFCEITRAQTDLIGWPTDKTLAKGLWARSQ